MSLSMEIKYPNLSEDVDDRIIRLLSQQVLSTGSIAVLLNISKDETKRRLRKLRRYRTVYPVTRKECWFWKAGEVK